MRVVALALLLLISPVALARAGAPARDLLYLGTANRGDAVYLAHPDGSDPLDLTGGVGLAYDPAWSPDGTQVAFATNRDVDGIGAAEIYVAAADGGSLRRLTFGATSAGGSKGSPGWSPDGSTIAWVQDKHQVWLAPAGGGTPRFLAEVGAQASGIWWSPDGTRLLTVQGGGPAILSVNVATGALGAVGIGDEPAWSPDGKQIAFYDVHAGSVAVENADGTGLHELTTFPSRDPAWLDATHVVFSGTTVETSLPNSRFGYPVRTDLWVARADGNGPPHRITGPFDELDLTGRAATAPAPSPDGSRLVFRASGKVTVANADGTCARPLDLGNVDAGPYWRPGSAGSPVSCVALWAHATVSAMNAALNSETVATIRVENHGNQTAHNVRVSLSPSTATTTLGGCNGGAVCSLGDLPPGGSQVATVDFAGFKVGVAGVRFAVDSYEDDLTAADAAGSVATDVLPCTIVGTWGADRLVGTPRADRICGLPGPDYISGGAGNDFIDGAAGNDTIYGGRGHDTILGKGGRDTIFARDGQRDWIDCGTEYDVAVVDKVDRVSHCERVIRG